MTNDIWALLDGYEGNWIAVDAQGTVFAHGPVLDDVIRKTQESSGRLTYLYAAAGRAEKDSAAV